MGSPVDTVAGLTGTLVKPIALLKVQILIFGALVGIASLAFGHFQTHVPLKCTLMGSGVLEFLMSGGFYCFCVVKGYAGNSYEKAIAEQGAKVVVKHETQVDRKPTHKRSPVPRGQDVSPIRDDPPASC